MAINRNSPDWDNPYRAPEIVFQPTLETPKSGTGFFWIRVFLYFQLLTTIVGVGLSSYEVETIVGSGPVLVFAGLFLAAFSARKRFWPGCWLGLSAPTFSLAVFLTIFLLDWRPSDARLPVPIMAMSYLLVCAIAFVSILWMLRSREQNFEHNRLAGNNAMDSVVS